jgi:uncharacterized protein
MMLVKTQLSLSGIHGIGLFAGEFIPKGTIVWKYSPDVDRVFTEQDLHGMNKSKKEFLETYCFKYCGKYYLCVDDARFMNHSTNPNCTDVGVDEIKENDLGYTMAKVDIQAGEELTCDYSFFGADEGDLEFNIYGLT